MASWYLYTCGHKGLQALSGQAETLMKDVCHPCRMARVGEVIPFLRHGTVPASGISRNYQDGSPEAGVSVYEVVNGEPQYCGWYFEIAQRPAYVGTGRIVGWGFDGEPVVEVLTISKQQRRRSTTCHKG